MSILSGGVPIGYRQTGERALTAIDIRWLHSAATDGRPISRMSCYASAINFFTSIEKSCILFLVGCKNLEVLRLDKSNKNRYLTSQVVEDLERKMVFIGGPRQVGKTTLAKEIMKKWGKTAAYMNWDRSIDRDKILKNQFPDAKLIVFDEIHKYRRWRGLVKGLFDHLHPHVKILVTGSARLDYYRFGGDSLQGRYHYLRLHTLSVKELSLKTQTAFEQLLRLGGFPEPYFANSDRFAKRWSREYRQRLVREDLASLEATQNLDKVELMMIRLPDLVGSPLSLNSLREDLEINYATAKKWFSILERLYHVFKVLPFGSSKIKAVKKEYKHYHFDWSLVVDPGARFENLIACHLLKWCHWLEDTEGDDMELRYFRDIEKREVDFVIVKNRKPELIIEVKSSDKNPTLALKYLHAKFPNVRAVQLCLHLDEPFRTNDGIEVLSGLDFLSQLPV